MLERCTFARIITDSEYEGAEDSVGLDQTLRRMAADTQEAFRNCRGPNIRFALQGKEETNQRMHLTTNSSRLQTSTIECPS